MDRRKKTSLTVTQFIATISVVAVVVLLVVSASATVRIRALIREQGDATKTAEIQTRIDATLGAIKDAETGQRGYLITGDNSYLAPYNAARHEIWVDVRALDGLFANSPGQRALLQQLKPTLDSKLREMAETIRLERHQGFAAARAVVVSNRGAKYMVTIRDLLNQMLQEQSQSLRQRLSDSAASGVETQRIIVLGSLLGVLIVSVTATLATGMILRPVRRITAAADRITVGDFTTSTPVGGPKELAVMARAINAALDAVTRVNGALQASEQHVQQLNVDLEVRVGERTTELASANRDLRTSNRELKASNREMDSFTYSVAHDLRTPLRSLYGYSELIQDEYADQLDEPGRDYFRRIQANTVQMEHLIDDLLRLSGAARGELALVSVDLSRMVREILEELSASEPERTVDFQVGLGMIVLADKRLARMMLYQLLANAWKFTSAAHGARIEIGKHRADVPGAFFVSDNGVGFDPRFVEKLFAPFQRLHEHDEFAGGGVGLALAERVAQRHGGRMWAESILGRGATFFFTMAPPDESND